MTDTFRERSRNRAGRFGVWLLLALPFAWVLYRYLTDAISYGQAIHQTGNWSVAFLVAALAATPMRKRFSTRRWPLHLLRHRRALGVASFACAAQHTVFYLERKWGFGYIASEAAEPGLLTGWAALLIFSVLAVTSNNASVRRLGRNWQKLHRAVYLATVLVFAHWILTAVDPLVAIICLLGICLIEALRWASRPPQR